MKNQTLLKTILLALICTCFNSYISQAQVVTGPFWNTPTNPTTVPTITDDWSYIGNNNPAVPANCVGCPPIPPMPNLSIESWTSEDVTNRVSLSIANNFNTFGQSDIANIVQVYRRTDGGAFESKFIIDGNGKVHIGLDPASHSAPGGFNLYVGQGILTERIKVATVGSSDWPDYVFKQGYNLMNLSDLETYLNEHNHLPDVPSAKDVENDGLDLAKMDAKLLQKIEELTLYVIDLKKENVELHRQIEDLKR